MIAMVAKLTLAKAKYVEDHPTCTEVNEAAEKLTKELTTQVDVDTQAYSRIADAFKLPKETDEDKAARKKAIADATLYATEVPFRTMSLAVEGLDCAQKLMGHFNTNCASDLGCAVLELLACVKGAWMNVMINVGGVADKEAGEAMQKKGEAMVAQAQQMHDRLYEEIFALCK